MKSASWSDCRHAWLMRLKWVFLLLPAVVQPGNAEEQSVRHEVESRFLKAPRTVRIYLPPSYHRDPGRRYPVLYLHDGQNLFSSAGTNICFGWGNWELDKTVDELARAGKIQELILVGIDNSPARYAEYCGRHHPAGTNANTEFENYSSFLIQELKPRIDSDYRTRPEATNTGTMGSSMGGICSIVLAWEHPEVFGRAASLSGAFQVEKTNFLNTILRPYRGRPKPTRVYFDSGVLDFTGGDDGQKTTAAIVGEFRRIGWGSELMHFVDVNPLTLAELEKTGLRRDKWSEAQTSQHNEFYWRLRVRRALTFLFFPLEQSQ
jgi:predicted alpha/beta superfamily hydrolase